MPFLDFFSWAFLLLLTTELCAVLFGDGWKCIQFSSLCLYMCFLSVLKINKSTRSPNQRLKVWSWPAIISWFCLAPLESKVSLGCSTVCNICLWRGGEKKPAALELVYAAPVNVSSQTSILSWIEQSINVAVKFFLSPSVICWFFKMKDEKRQKKARPSSCWIHWQMMDMHVPCAALFVFLLLQCS